MARSADADLAHDTRLVADPAALAHEPRAASWPQWRDLAFAAIGGPSHVDVARPVAANVVPDPPRIPDLGSPTVAG